MSEILNKVRKLEITEHILHRPGMYIGSTSTNTVQSYVPELNEELGEMVFAWQDVNENLGILKLIDEILSNSVDEHRRETNLGLNKISVTMWDDGRVQIHDNGGIPVVWHDEYGCYMPELVFGNLFTGTNFDDDEQRKGVGTNGVGSTLTNIYSKTFIVETADGKNSFAKMWNTNMTDSTEAEVKSCKKHYTTITFVLDLKRFGLESLEQIDSIHGIQSLVHKRCIDAAASNPKLRVSFTYNDNTHEYAFAEFGEYVSMYDKSDASMICEKNDDWEFYLSPVGNDQIGLVNGAQCDSGTHMKLIKSRVNSLLQKHLLRKHGIDMSHSALSSKYSCYVCMDVLNPSYDAQTKDVLETKAARFTSHGEPAEFSKGFIRSLLESEIVDSILDWHRQKTEADTQRTLRIANREASKMLKIPKLIDANAPNRNRSGCELFIFEGNSAISGLRTNRDANTQAGYALRGKVKNVVDGTHKDIVANTELRDLIAAINLKLGSPDDIENIRYDRIIICTDMDPDGHSICGLLIAFFVTHYPGLVRAGKLYRAHSPFMIAQSKSQRRLFYNKAEYEAVQDKIKDWRVRYIKGLGSLESADYKDMLRNPVLEQFVFDDETESMVNCWFSGGSAKRKQLLESL